MASGKPGAVQTGHIKDDSERAEQNCVVIAIR
jgi:hypothetical protein